MPFEPPPAAHAAALWAGLLLLLMLVLSILAVSQRRRHKVAYGDADQPRLAAAIRAFGNAAEYVPVALGALVVLALAGAQAWVVHIGGAILLAGRISHAVGLSFTTGVSLGRSYGMLLTWVAYLYLIVALLFHALA